jgi:hypothetical protein
MIIDRNLLFSDEQALTATADAARSVPLKDARDIANGVPLYLVFQVVETLDSAGEAATLTLTLTTDDNSGLSSDADLRTLATTIPEASLVQGYRRVFKIDPELAWQTYAGLRYNVGTENFTAGKVTAFLTTDPEVWKAYESAQANG